MTDIYLIEVPAYANQADIRLFDPTTAPDVPGATTSPVMTLLGVGGG